MRLVTPAIVSLPETWDTAKNRLNDMLEKLVLSIRAGWNVEHTPDGTHVNVTLTGGQITFPATAVPSPNPTTLDAYKEGVWVPVDGSGAGLAVDSVGFINRYVKVGRAVTIYGYIRWPATASGVQAMVAGLPFPLSTTPGSLAIGYNTSAFPDMSGYIRENTSRIEFFSPIGPFTNAQLSTAIIAFSGQYYAAA